MTSSHTVRPVVRSRAYPRLRTVLLGVALYAASVPSAWCQADSQSSAQRSDKSAPPARDSMPLSPGFPTPGGTRQGSANDHDRSMATPPAANPAAAQTANPNNPDNMPVKKPKGTARGDDEMSHHDLPRHAVPK